MPATSVSSEHDRDRALAELHRPRPRAWTFALRISQRVPTTSVSYRTTRPRTNGHFAERCPWKPESSALGRGDDRAVRVAQGDGDRIATAHQDALDEGLAAVGVSWAWRAVYRTGASRPGIGTAGRRPAARIARGPRPGLGPDLALQALLEALDLAGRVDDRLLAREERVAVASRRRRAAPAGWNRPSTRCRTSRSGPWPRSTWDGCRASRDLSPRRRPCRAVAQPVVVG